MHSQIRAGATGMQWSTQMSTGSRGPVAMFILMLAAFVIQSQLAQYVQNKLDFRQPYFLFYLAHSSLMALLPLHLLWLRVTTSRPISAYCRDLDHAVRTHLNPAGVLRSKPTDPQQPFPLAKLLSLVGWLTAGVTVPSVLWYTAITFSSVSDVTAIWNSNAFWAYVISVKVNDHDWEKRKLLSVLIASLGVLMVVYGGEKQESPSSAAEAPTDVPSAPFIGNVLTLLASFSYGLYQVMYKMYATLPEAATLSRSTTWRRLSISSTGESVHSIDDDTANPDEDEDIQSTSFGLYPNFLTACIGLLTCLVMWIFLPVLHYTEIEQFALPKDVWTSVCVFGIVFTGMMFYMTFMILLGVWGPIVTSVGSLLTIVLVLISDVLLGALETLTLWGVTGSAMIVIAFGVLAHDALKP